MGTDSGPTQALCDALREGLKYRICDVEREHEKSCADFEKRIRELEEFKWKLIGAAAVAGGIAGFSASFLL
jgi:uncharacterized protein (UPF0179 family)